MKLSDFDFQLPNELIAQTPSPQRGESRLLVLDRTTATIEHARFSALPRYLKDHPVMVFNDTRVLPAKLEGTVGENGKRIEILLVKEEEPGTWQVLMKDLKKYKPGQRLIFGKGGLPAEFIGRKDDTALVRFALTHGLANQLEEFGKMPLPHYIHRSPDDDADTGEQDRERYQTVYARHTGAIAAPTAGLHFTGEMLSQLTDCAEPVYLTLHVGPGTFQPVRDEEIRKHKMKKEYYNIPVETWNAILRAKNGNRKIVAVGTTSTRVLESIELNREEKNDVSGWTDRFIYPGQTFKNTDHLLTNFHLPKSTLFMLVCALAGPSLMQKAYREAIQKKYRFFSYGDAMLIL
ncbi:MAG: tRNA preQ1(34) S-adenosylmethionine ribosyltransferase-isomerase QueA [Nitrospinota bacterium]|nr:tRNA preQ1(34) S-adenosylmethionine ribosyltransferase-isomerase QueA [Nitrospinota bacterium]